MTVPAACSCVAGIFNFGVDMKVFLLAQWVIAALTAVFERPVAWAAKPLRARTSTAPWRD